MAKSFRISAKFDLRDFDTLNMKLTRAINQGVHQVAHLHEREWKERARRLTGSLADSIHVDQGRASAQYVVKDNVRNPEDGQPYGVFQELGTGEYAETFGGTPMPGPPVQAWGDFMTFTWKGQEWSRKSVRGTPPSHAAKEALDAVMPRISTVIAGVINAMNAAAMAGAK